MSFGRANIAQNSSQGGQTKTNGAPIIRGKYCSQLGLVMIVRTIGIAAINPANDAMQIDLVRCFN